MKTKLQISIAKNGISVSNLVKIVASHNEGLNLFFIKEVVTIVRGLKTEYPTTLSDMKLEFIEDDGLLNVYEDGKTLTYSIQESHYYDLNMIDTDGDLTKQIAHEDALLSKIN